MGKDKDMPLGDCAVHKPSVWVAPPPCHLPHSPSSLWFPSCFLWGGAGTSVSSRFLLSAPAASAPSSSVCPCSSALSIPSVAFMVLHGRILQAHRCFCSVLGHVLWSCRAIPHVPSRILLFLMSPLGLPASSASSSRRSPFWLCNYSSS